MKGNTTSGSLRTFSSIVPQLSIERLNRSSFEAQTHTAFYAELVLRQKVTPKVPTRHSADHDAHGPPAHAHAEPESEAEWRPQNPPLRVMHPYDRNQKPDQVHLDLQPYGCTARAMREASAPSARARGEAGNSERGSIHIVLIIINAESPTSRAHAPLKSRRGAPPVLRPRLSPGGRRS